MDKLLLTSNIITFVGMSIATVAALFKAKRRVLLFQSGNHVLEIVAQFLTKAYSGMVQEIIALLYSLTLVFVKSPKKAPKVIVSALCLVAGLAIGVVINVRFSDNVWYGYLPIVANVIYTLCVIVAFCADKDESQGDLLLKVGLMINVACWGVYGWFVRLYPVMAFNAAAFLFAAISVVRILYAKKPPDPLSSSAEDDGQEEGDLSGQEEIKRETDKWGRKTG